MAEENKEINSLDDLFQLKASHFRSVMNDYINLSVTEFLQLSKML